MKNLSIYIAVFAFLLLTTRTLSAQDGGVLISGGMASSRMDDMKYLQEYILSSYPVEGKITSSFPPYTAISVTVFKKLYDQIRIGGSYSYSITGGKSSYSDFSGNLTTEMSAVSHRLGAYTSYAVLGGDRLELSVYGKVEANLSTLNIQSAFTIQSISNRYSNAYRSISPSGTVGAELLYRIGYFSVGLDGGYLVDLTGDLKDKNSSDPLLDPADSHRVLSSDWTGWMVKIKGLVWLNF